MGYSIDTSGLITSWQVTHNPKNHPSFWDKLDALIANRELRASEEVLEDLSKKDDDVYNWAKLRPDMFVLRLYPRHKKTTEIIISTSSNTPVDTGTWLYNPKTGKLIINCTHYKKIVGSDRWDSL